jgi:hypothetical protein
MISNLSGARMTFYEAAVEVLREAGRPLHYKKIAEISVTRNLLSHVGKTPDATMGARLQQEARKPIEETLIVQVRPGVYSLREGVDVSDARETISLRTPPPEEAVDTPVAESASDDSSGETADEVALDAPANDDSESLAAENVEVPDDAEMEAVAEAGDAAPADTAAAQRDRRRRRRGRRGGRNRSRPDAVGGSDEDGDDDGDADGADDATASVAVPAPEALPVQPVTSFSAPRGAQRELREAREPRDPKRDNGGDRRPLEIPNLHHLSDVARGLVTILRAARDNADSLRNLARELPKQNIGALGRIGPAIVRSEIERANLIQSQLGRPPLFEEVRPDVYALASASASDLARSYAQLDTWQESHRDAVKRTLLNRLTRLDASSLTSLITLALDRMGYRQQLKHDPVGDELVNISCVEPRALTSVQIAVRILPPGRKVTREQVMSMRGSLHNYEASEGAIIAVGGIEESALRESRVPNLSTITLVDAATLIDHLITNGVGVRTFTVDVSCIDEPLFRDLVHEPH